MRQGAKRDGSSGLVTASEIACYAYCPEQWRLQYGLGLPAQNRAALAAGTRHHARKAGAERAAVAALALGRLLALLALLGLPLRMPPGVAAPPPGAAGAPRPAGAAPAAGVRAMIGTPWLAVAAGLALLLGLVSMLLGRGLRRRHGLGTGRTVALDSVTLVSRRHELTGRPDRLVKSGGTVIPEEWKSSRALRPWHAAQLGVDFLLIEDQFGVKPPYGFVVTGDGARHRIDNDERLRAWVLDLAGQIRAARAAVGLPIPVNLQPGQCRPCGMRDHCGQARD